MDRNGFAIVLITTSQDEESQLIARVLLEQRKAACVNIVPKISSLYWWNNVIQQDKESLLIVKTRTELLDEVIRLVKEVHSYEVPEIIALPVFGGNQEYLEWIDREVVAEEVE
ncbi:MAG: divalent-cation tolerance protein CutA [Dehalococcoidaceae bacterium]|nr:divalent-cation tolerance protein CutA [Dehalococcoidaceae bacterium]